MYGHELYLCELSGPQEWGNYGGTPEDLPAWLQISERKADEKEHRASGLQVGGDSGGRVPPGSLCKGQAAI